MENFNREKKADKHLYIDTMKTMEIQCLRLSPFMLYFH